ncbi:BLOC-1-related complex subunit 5-like [Montipora foliosa]|uniref:BLOC-1-related complex subunit 5-like n=1 Tax=Montipora foliosa TaxID=591990 RepID=UPI0035F1C20E
MGQDQSNSLAGQTGHQNVTSFSVEKEDSKPRPKQRAKLEDIMVVNAPTGTSKSATKGEDEDIKSITRLPFYYPLLRGTVNVPAARELEFLDRFDPRPCLSLCTRYEQHLKQCAEAVAFDQNMLSSRVREIDAYSAAVLRRVNDRFKRFSLEAGQLRKVEEMNANLRRIDGNLKRLVPTMERLNNMLPEGERLENFEVFSGTVQ